MLLRVRTGLTLSWARSYGKASTSDAASLESATTFSVVRTGRLRPRFPALIEPLRRCCVTVPLSDEQTPNLDRLAADGVLFEQHFAQATPCGPSRASLYTGMYLQNHRSVDNGTPLDTRHTNVALETRHIPLIVRDPRAAARHARGRRVSAFTENVDVMPTILDGLQVPIRSQCDGEALGPFCAGETPADWRTEAHWEFDFRHFIDANGDSVQGLKPDQCAMTTENVNAPVLFICANYGERFRTARLSLSLL